MCICVNPCACVCEHKHSCVVRVCKNAYAYVSARVCPRAPLYKHIR